MSWQAIRDARDKDCGAIAAIYSEAIVEGRSTFETQPRSAADIGVWLGSPRHPVLVAEQDHEIAGWARVAPYSTRPCYDSIAEASVYVHARARGHGIGNALAVALCERAQQAAFTKLLGKCLTTNETAVKLVAPRMADRRPPAGIWPTGGRGRSHHLPAPGSHLRSCG